MREAISNGWELSNKHIWSVKASMRAKYVFTIALQAFQMKFSIAQMKF